MRETYRVPRAQRIILGPSFTEEIVNGQYDVAGNVHGDPIPKQEPVRHY